MTMRLSHKLDLFKIAKSPNTEYDEGVRIIKFRHPMLKGKGQIVMIFRSGTLVSVGANSVRKAKSDLLFTYNELNLSKCKL